MTPSCTIDRRPRNSKHEIPGKNPQDSKAAPHLTRDYILQKNFQNFFQTRQNRGSIRAHRAPDGSAYRQAGLPLRATHLAVAIPNHRASPPQYPQSQSVVCHRALTRAPCASEHERGQTHTRPGRDRRSQRHTVRPVPGRPRRGACQCAQTCKRGERASAPRAGARPGPGRVQVGPRVSQACTRHGTPRHKGGRPARRHRAPTDQGA